MNDAYSQINALRTQADQLEHAALADELKALNGEILSIANQVQKRAEQMYDECSVRTVDTLPDAVSTIQHGLGASICGVQGYINSASSCLERRDLDPAMLNEARREVGVIRARVREARELLARQS